MIKIYLSVITCALLISCGSETVNIQKKEGNVSSSIAAGNVSDEELAAQLKEYENKEKERLKEIEARVTSLKFDKLKHDFGDVQALKENFTTFTVTNTGNKPLIIDDVAASCGCTMPKKPEGPIAPGESDVIEVVFKSKPGQVNEILKTITVTANTMEKIHEVEIRAFVIE